MLMSGWRIYNASPVFAEVRFPPEMTLGGWLAGALAWHFAVMWLLVLNGLAYLAYGIFSGHFWRDLISFSPMSAYRNLRLELKTIAVHGTGEYNIIQRVMYICVIWIVIALVVSGMAIWKPVQFQTLTALLGGYEQARRVHFFAMVGLSHSWSSMSAPPWLSRGRCSRCLWDAWRRAGVKPDKNR